MSFMRERAAYEVWKEISTPDHPFDQCADEMRLMVDVVTNAMKYPTDEMLEAAEAELGVDAHQARRIWKVMLEAACQAEPPTLTKILLPKEG